MNKLESLYYKVGSSEKISSSDLKVCLEVIKSSHENNGSSSSGCVICRDVAPILMMRELGGGKYYILAELLGEIIWCLPPSVVRESYMLGFMLRMEKENIGNSPEKKGSFGVVLRLIANAIYKAYYSAPGLPSLHNWGAHFPFALIHQLFQLAIQCKQLFTSSPLHTQKLISAITPIIFHAHVPLPDQTQIQKLIPLFATFSREEIINHQPQSDIFGTQDHIPIPTPKLLNLDVDAEIDVDVDVDIDIDIGPPKERGNNISNIFSINNRENVNCTIELCSENVELSGGFMSEDEVDLKEFFSEIDVVSTHRASTSLNKHAQGLQQIAQHASNKEIICISSSDDEDKSTQPPNSTFKTPAIQPQPLNSSPEPSDFQIIEAKKGDSLGMNTTPYDNQHNTPYSHLPHTIQSKQPSFPNYVRRNRNMKNYEEEGKEIYINGYNNYKGGGAPKGNILTFDGLTNLENLANSGRKPYLTDLDMPYIRNEMNNNLLLFAKGLLNQIKQNNENIHILCHEIKEIGELKELRIFEQTPLSSLLSDPIPICLYIKQSKLGAELLPRIKKYLHERYGQRGIIRKNVDENNVPAMRYSDSSSVYYKQFSTKLSYVLYFGNQLEEYRRKLYEMYLRYDSRVPNLAVIIINWAKKRKIINRKGYMSSNGFISLLIYFLQLNNPPILPSLQNMAVKLGVKNIIQIGREEGKRKKQKLATLDLGFGDIDIQKLKTQCQKEENYEQLGDLLVKFFYYYGFEFMEEAKVESKIIALNSLFPVAKLIYAGIYIQDPLLGEATKNSFLADGSGFKKLMMEFKMAYYAIDQKIDDYFIDDLLY